MNLLEPILFETNQYTRSLEGTSIFYLATACTIVFYNTVQNFIHDAINWLFKTLVLSISFDFYTNDLICYTFKLSFHLFDSLRC